MLSIPVFDVVIGIDPSARSCGVLGFVSVCSLDLVYPTFIVSGSTSSLGLRRLDLLPLFKLKMNH